jgi:hypothetical protein
VPDNRIGHVRREQRVESRIPIPPAAPVSFEVVLRYAPSRQAEIDDEARRLLSGGRPEASRAAATGAAREADPADIQQIRDFAAAQELTVESVDRGSRIVRLRGDAATVNRLWGVTLVECRAGSESWREYDGQPRVPSAIADIVEATLGLSTKPVA